MIADKIIWEGKEIDSYDGKVIDEIIFDGQSYNFARESDELSSADGSVELDDSVPERLRSLFVSGKSRQDTYRGVNRFDFNSVSSWSIPSSTTYEVKDSGITINTNQAWGYASTKTIVDKKLFGETFTVSYALENLSGTFNTSRPHGINVRYYHNDGKEFASSNYAQTFTAPEYTDGDYVMLTLIAYSGGGDVSITYKNIQIEPGNVATEYEPYVGGISSPNPNFPQPIYSMEDVDIIMRSKNLVNYHEGFTALLGASHRFDGNSIIVSTNGANGYPVIRYVFTNPDLFNTYLTLSFSLSTKQTATFTHVAVDIYHNSTKIGNMALKELGMNNRRIVVTTNSKVPAYSEGDYIRLDIFGYYTHQNADVDFLSYSDLQIERGTTATRYSPYFDSKTVSIPKSSGIVLRSIGNFQDELVIDSLAGTVRHIQRIRPVNKSSKYVVASSSGYNAYFATIRYGTVGVLADSVRMTVVMSNKLKGLSQVEFGSKPTPYYSVLAGGDGIVFRISDTTTLDEAKAFFLDDSFECYAVYNENIETDISNTDLGKSLLAMSTGRGDVILTVASKNGVTPTEVKTKYWKQIRATDS